MKKLVVASILVSAMGLSAFGQGALVVFNNDANTRVLFTTEAKAQLGSLVGATDVGPKGSTLFRAELYYSPSATDPGNEGMLGGVMAPTGFAGLGSGGTFSGGQRTVPSTTAPAGQAWFQVKVWELAFGQTYEAAVNAAPLTIGGVTRQAIAGASNRFRMATGDPNDLSPEPNIVQGGFQGFQIQAVPEPSTYALGLLGLAGMFLLRRRNSK